MGNSSWPILHLCYLSCSFSSQTFWRPATRLVEKIFYTDKNTNRYTASVCLGSAAFWHQPVSHRFNAWHPSSGCASGILEFINFAAIYKFSELIWNIYWYLTHIQSKEWPGCPGHKNTYQQGTRDAASCIQKMWGVKDRKVHASLYTLTRLISSRSTVGFHLVASSRGMSAVIPWYVRVLSLNLLRRSWIQIPIWCLQIKIFEGRW